MFFYSGFLLKIKFISKYVHGYNSHSSSRRLYYIFWLITKVNAADNRFTLFVMTQKILGSVSIDTRERAGWQDNRSSIPGSRCSSLRWVQIYSWAHSASYIMSTGVISLWAKKLQRGFGSSSHLLRLLQMLKLYLVSPVDPRSKVGIAGLRCPDLLNGRQECYPLDRDIWQIIVQSFYLSPCYIT
jgi:hypothetical protein